MAAKKDDEKMMTTAELAERWSISEITLKKWRVSNTGPKYIKLGDRKVLYRYSDVLEYENESVVKTEG